VDRTELTLWNWTFRLGEPQRGKNARSALEWREPFAIGRNRVQEKD
jgi:hypothetical protein